MRFDVPLMFLGISPVTLPDGKTISRVNMLESGSGEVYSFFISPDSALFQTLCISNLGDVLTCSVGLVRAEKNRFKIRLLSVH